jgi:hypothetical protein
MAQIVWGLITATIVLQSHSSTLQLDQVYRREEACPAFPLFMCRRLRPRSPHGPGIVIPLPFGAAGMKRVAACNARTPSATESAAMTLSSTCAGAKAVVDARKETGEVPALTSVWRHKRRQRACTAG